MNPSSLSNQGKGYRQNAFKCVFRFTFVAKLELALLGYGVHGFSQIVDVLGRNAGHRDAAVFG